jgi:hypothetical protein
MPVAFGALSQFECLLAEPAGVRRPSRPTGTAPRSMPPLYTPWHWQGLPLAVSPSPGPGGGPGPPCAAAVSGRADSEPATH